MVIKNFVQIGNPQGREKSKPVKDFSDPKVKRTIKNLLDTMVPGGLIGLAAPQLGVQLRIFTTQMRKTKSRPNSKADKPRVFVNPKIVWQSKEQELDWEGCGSVIYGEIFAQVKRPKKIRVRAKDEKGKEFELEAECLLARIIQHENDHLDGIFFTDRMEPSTIISRSEYLKARKEGRI